MGESGPSAKPEFLLVFDQNSRRKPAYVLNKYVLKMMHRTLSQM